MIARAGIAEATHARGGLLPASIHVFEVGWREYVDCTSGARCAPYCQNYLEPKNYLEVPEWQDDKLERELPQQYPSRRLLPFSYICVLGWDGSRRVTF